MESESERRKVKLFAQNLMRAGEKNALGVGELFRLRISARELYAVLDNREGYRLKIEELLRLTNRMRDIDLFSDAFLPALPEQYRVELDVNEIFLQTKSEREKRLNKLRGYLDHFKIPDQLNFCKETECRDVFVVHEFSFIDKKALYQYRAYIRDLLYREGYQPKHDEAKIEIMTEIKENLGEINNNFNALKRLDMFNVNMKIFSDISDYVDRENDKLFKKFQVQNLQLY